MIHPERRRENLKKIEEMDKQKADMVEVVRCKNCKYHYVDGDNVRYNMCLLLHNKAQPDDWFCADGEPKDDSTGSCGPDYCELNLDGDDQ